MDRDLHLRSRLILPGYGWTRSPGTGEAVGPAEDKDEHEMSERAVPKPDHQLVGVRRNAGKVVEIRRDEAFNDDNDDSVDVDELNEAWELMAVNRAEDDEDDQPLEGASATSYRAATARLNYVSPDRIDVQYATKEAARFGAESVAHERAS